MYKRSQSIDNDPRKTYAISKNFSIKSIAGRKQDLTHYIYALWHLLHRDELPKRIKNRGNREFEIDSTRFKSRFASLLSFIYSPTIVSLVDDTTNDRSTIQFTYRRINETRFLPRHPLFSAVADIDIPRRLSDRRTDRNIKKLGTN